MQQPNTVAGRNILHQPRYHILIIDDSIQLRTLLARHIMLSCNSYQRSCAIYRLGERAEPRLTYFYNPADPSETEPNGLLPDFTVYEAASPRHALNWLQQTRPTRLTIISDVMMPVDTEVGLPGLLTGLNHLQIAVNLVFISSEPQNIKHVQTLLNNQRAFFLIKGSEAWNRLPQAIVEGAERFNYQLLPRQAYSNPAIFPEATPPVEIKPQPTRRFNGVRNFGNIEVRTVTKATSVGPTAIAASAA